jgi:hypothetical protein
MADSLASVSPGSSYPSLIKIGDNSSLTSGSKVLSDGEGNELPLEASSTSLYFSTDPTGISGSPVGSYWDYTTGRFGIGTTGPLNTLDVAGILRTRTTANGGGMIVNPSGGTVFLTLSNDLSNSTALTTGVAKRYNINSAFFYNLTDWANGNTPQYIDATKPNEGAAALALMMDGYGGSPGFHFYAPDNMSDTISRNRMFIRHDGNVSIGVLGGSGGSLTIRSKTDTSSSSSLRLTNFSNATTFEVKGDGSQTWATGATAGEGATASHKIPVTINGETYYLLATK